LLPDWFAVVLGNGFVLLSLCFFSGAVHRLVLDEDAPQWQWRLVVASGIGVAIVASAPVPLRMSVIAALFAAQLLPPVMLIARHRRRIEPSLRTVAAMLASAIVVLALRVVYAWAHRADYAGSSQGIPDNGLAVLLSFLMLGAGFALVLAILERLTIGMKQLATHDGLTGCVNRVYFDAILNHALERGRRDKAPVSLLLMDLDRLQHVNDRHGHSCGDDVLRSFAQCVRARIRKSDVFGRLGGEEFGLILPLTDKNGAVLLAERIRIAFESLPGRAPGGEPIVVTVSLGVSTALPRNDLSGNEAYSDAEEALSEAKRQGGNRAVHHDAEVLKG
jgi:diguanylate cyclase (GGDEF)-like protein